MALLAALFLVAPSLAGAQQPDPRAEQPQQAEAEPQTPPESAVPPFTPYPRWYEEACYNAESHDAADLCAQWRAAVAAERAAEAADQAVTWSIIATILSALALGALLWTLRQTEGALKEARTGNVLAMRQNARSTRRAIASAKETQDALKYARDNAAATRKLARVAQETGRAQLRAYVTVEPGGVNVAMNGIVRVPLFIQNVGETPAHKVMSFSRFGLDPHPRDFDVTKLEGWDSWLKGEINDATLGRGVARYIYPYTTEDFLSGHMEAIAEKEVALIHFGHVIYEDIYGDTHRTNFAFYHWGEELSPETSLRCRFGNTAD